MGRLRISLRDKEGSGYLGEVKEFFAAIVEERQPVSPPKDARRDLEIVLSSYDALSRQSSVKIQPVGGSKVDS